MRFSFFKVLLDLDLQEFLVLVLRIRRLAGEARESYVQMTAQNLLPLGKLVIHQRVEWIDDDGTQSRRRIANEVVENRHLIAESFAAARASRHDCVLTRQDEADGDGLVLVKYTLTKAGFHGFGCLCVESQLFNRLTRCIGL